MHNFSTVFVDFSMSLQYLLKYVSALKFPFTAREYNANNSVPSVVSIILMTIIGAKIGQNGIDCNCIEDYFD